MSARLVSLIAGVGAATCLTIPLDAQDRPPRVPRQVPGAQDTTARDTTRLVEWAEPDSVMAELLARAGYLATRYQGDRVIFNAKTKEIIVLGTAAVGREQTTLIADTIRYNDSLKVIQALGDTIVLRDPSQAADLVARGQLRYDIASKQGTGTDIETRVETGEVWFVEGPHTGFRTDTTSGERTFYATSGSITSCDLTEPHYHFKAKEVKMIGRRALIARPAILYIRDIPVLWVPFIYQDLRKGRRSGLLPPRFGFSDIVRNSTTYRRHIDGLGWYWAMSDYMDAQVEMGWRSGARGTDADPGWLDWRAQWKYNWLSRAMRGGLAWSNSSWTNGRSGSSYRLWHSQQFSQKSSLRADLNYQTNTSLERDRSVTVEQTFATIYSSLSYDRDFGLFRMALGGTQQQSAGREEIRRTLPTLSLTPRGAISLASWLEWTPQLNLTNSQTLDMNVSDPRVGFRYTPRPGGGQDSAQIVGDQRTTDISVSDADPNLQFQLDEQHSAQRQGAESPGGVGHCRSARSERAASARLRQGIQHRDRMGHAVLAAEHLSGAAQSRPVDPGDEPEQRTVCDPERAHWRGIRATGETPRVRAFHVANALWPLSRLWSGNALPSHDLAEPVVYLRTEGQREPRVSGRAKPVAGRQP